MQRPRQSLATGQGSHPLAPRKTCGQEGSLGPLLLSHSLAWAWPLSLGWGAASSLSQLSTPSAVAFPLGRLPSQTSHHSLMQALSQAVGLRAKGRV